ncbi:MAG: hypothetical protein AAGD92_09010, partial [Pseudomonadota bacterium]
LNCRDRPSEDGVRYADVLLARRDPDRKITGALTPLRIRTVWQYRAKRQGVDKSAPMAGFVEDFTVMRVKRACDSRGFP